MVLNKAKKFLFGAVLVGGLATGVKDCSPDNENQNDDQDTKTTTITSDKNHDPYGNIALFELTRSKIKFALNFVENYYEYTYFCGKAWTTGAGLTTLYKPNGKSTKVTKNTKPVTMAESDVYMGRYLTREILPDIKSCIHVPMDENTLIAACALRYCIGGDNFKKSSFVKQLNKGKRGAELAKTLTGWRQQEGVPLRCYFFAALMANKITFNDLLYLRAEGCYNLTWKDIFVHRKGEPIRDKNNFLEWDFSKIHKNLEKAKASRTAVLTTKNGKIKVKCKLVKEIVPDYIWQEVSNGTGICIAQNEQEESQADNPAQDENHIGYIAVGAAALGAAAIYRRRKSAGRE